ncbi:MAG: FAA hydrolase family protein, partial [Ignavibacteriales bacterium]|nr:FAA hydrolase family protein [Ignavibacteriales bacterium]
MFTGTPEGVAQVVKGDRLEARLLQSSNKTLASLTVGVQ